MSRRILLAYSGDMEAAVAIPALADSRKAEIVTLTIDLGAAWDLEEIRDRAIAAGAVRAHVIDAREEFVRDFVLPSLRAGALRSGVDPMAAALARPLVARKLSEVAAIEQADEVSDRSRTDENLWGRQGATFVRTKSVDEAPAVPAYLEITFDRGTPTAVSGVPMPMTELIESVAIIAGHHGVGRIAADAVCVEAPAAVVLHAAYAALSSEILPADSLRAKRARAGVYTQLISDGEWLALERESIDAENAQLDQNVTGIVRMKLFKGSLEPSDVRVAAHAVPPA
jgi:argininosuccinate synthase